MVRYGLSAKLYNKLGFEFWESYRRKGLTRIQAIFKEVEAGRGSPHGGVYLAVNHLPASLIENYLKQQRGAKWCTGLESIGFDLSREAIEVYISVLSTLGGCNIDAHCKTNVPGLFAAGELASGFDGAHTLAGNMMTMCFASGSIAGRAAAEEAKVRQQMEIDEQQVQELHSKLFAPLEHDNGVRPFEVKRQIREIMWEFCNVAGRTKEGLETAIKEIETMKVEKLPQLCPHAKNKQFNLEWLECIEIENMLTVCEMTLRAALTRTESRGLHFREDFPQLDPNFTKSIIISKERERMSVKTEQVAFPYLKPKGEQR